MSGPIATLSIDIVAKLASLQASLGEAGKIAQRNADTIESAYTTAGKRIGQVIAGLGLGALVVDALHGLKESVLALERLNDVADATGASVEKLSGLEDVALRTGNSMESITGALTHLNKALQGEMSKGESSAVGEALRRIGLDADELRRADPADALVKVAVALKGFADDGNKARLVYLLTGRAIQEVAPLLKDLGEAGEIHAKVTREEARAAEDLANQLRILNKESEDVRRSMLLGIIPALNELLREFRAGKATLGGTKGGFNALFGIDVNNTNVEADLKAAEDALGKLFDKRKAMEEKIRDNKPGANAFALEQYTTEGARLQLIIAYYKRLLDLRKEAAAPNVAAARPSTGTVGGGDKAAPEKDPKFFVTPLSGNLQEALKLIDQSDPVKAEQLRAVLQELVDLRPTEGQTPAGLAAAIAGVRKELEKLDPVTQRAEEQKRRIEALINASPQGQLRALTADAELLHEQLDITLDPERAQQLTEALDAVYASMDRLAGNVEKTGDKMDTFAKQAARNIESSLADTLYMGLTGKFDSILDLWKNLLLRMAAEAAAAKLSRWLFGPEFGKTGEIGGAIGDLWKIIKPGGGGGGMDFQGGFATGGDIFPGRWGIVGERGPEIVRGPATVTPLGGPAFSYSPTIVVQGEVGPATVGLVERMLARERARAMRSAIA